MKKANPWAPKEAPEKEPQREKPSFERLQMPCPSHGADTVFDCKTCGRFVALHCDLCGSEYRGHHAQPVAGVYRCKYTGGLLIHKALTYRCSCKAGQRKSPMIPAAPGRILEAVKRGE